MDDLLLQLLNESAVNMIRS